jgi:probable phosphoglycerate mutase
VAADLERAGLAATLLLCSDLLRAVQTAQIVGARLGLAPRQNRRLREQALGRLEGRGHVAARASVADVDWSDPDVAIGGGEAARQVFDRMAEVLGPITGMNAIVVSHGDAIRYALGWLAGHHAADCPWHDIGPGAVFAVDADAPPRRLD